MPSSLVVVALVLAWLVVLVPMIVRKRQEVTKPADSELAARVVRSGSGEAGGETAEEADMHDADAIDEDFGGELAEDVTDEPSEDAADEDDSAEPAPDMTYYEDSRRYRPGRGGFDPEAAAVIARAKYAYRQRVVLAMLIGAVVTAVTAGVAFPVLWWGHGAIDLVLVSYLVYLRRQVRIETEIRERRQARMNRVRRSRPRYVEPPVEETYEEYEETYVDEVYEPEEPARRERVADGPYTPTPTVSRHGAVVVDVDDEDPAFDELDEPSNLPYRRAVGE
jgi:hypothetical protein